MLSIICNVVEVEGLGHEMGLEPLQMNEMVLAVTVRLQMPLAAEEVEALAKGVAVTLVMVLAKRSEMVLVVDSINQNVMVLAVALLVDLVKKVEVVSVNRLRIVALVETRRVQVREVVSQLHLHQFCVFKEFNLCEIMTSSYNSIKHLVNICSMC